MILLIKDNQRFLNRLHIFLDALVIIGAYMMAWVIKFKWKFLLMPGDVLPRKTYFRVLFIIVPVYIVLYTAFQLYTSRRVHSIRYEVKNVIEANMVGILLFLTILYITKQQHFSRTMLALFFILNIVFEILLRALVKYVLISLRKRGFNTKKILLVGYSRAAEEYIDRIKANQEWGYTIVGILDDNKPTTEEYNGVYILGKVDSLFDILQENELDEIAITLSLSEYGRFESIVKLCEKSGVHTQFVPDYNHIIPTKPYTEDIMGLPVINIRYVPLNNEFHAAVKRLFDILGSLAGIILLFPLMTIIGIMVKVTSKGPLIFKQERVGLHNKTFMMYKFRTMKVQNAEDEKKAWTTKNDSRVTKIGSILRKTSLDELPQLFNIFLGQMSIVGPRPERPFFVERFKEEIPRYMVKHQVRPGLTGWAQVNGYRGDTSIMKRIEYDLYYIENWSYSLDVKIMFMTIFKGMINKNAY